MVGSSFFLSLFSVLLTETGFVRKVEDFQEWFICSSPDLELFNIAKELISGRIQYYQNREIQSKFQHGKAQNNGKEKEQDLNKTIQTEIK